jgi:cytochrome c-type biogenesis protein CcmH
MKIFCNKITAKFFIKNFTRIFSFIKIFGILIFFSANSLALNPENKLADPKLEKRAMDLFLIVKCLVCDGQVIENSQTQFASDLKELIRNKISQGMTDKQIKTYLIETFGEDIITEPSNFYLGIFLIISLIIASGVFVFFINKNK